MEAINKVQIFDATGLCGCEERGSTGRLEGTKSTQKSEYTKKCNLAQFLPFLPLSCPGNALNLSSRKKIKLKYMGKRLII